MGDLHAQRVDHVSAFERWLVGHDHPLLPP